MEELSAPEMLSLRGGANAAAVLSLGNVAIAVPIDIVVLSGNAVGSGSQASVSTVQNATANAGNIFANIAQLA